MHSFKRLVKSVSVSLLIFSLLSVTIIFPCTLDGSDYNDARLRKSLSGKINYIFSGASQAIQAFDPRIIDKELDVCSYNLSSYAASMSGRLYLLEKEINRNNVNTVVIDISYDTLLRSSENEHSTGEPMTICKLDTFSEKIDYFFSNVSFIKGDYEKCFSVFLRYGIKSWGKLLKGNFGVHPECKGFVGEKSYDVSLNDNEIIGAYNSSEVSLDFNEKNLYYLNKTIDLCVEKGIRVIIAILPISDSRLWQYKNCDDFLSKLNYVCPSNVSVFDFNLLKNRYELFNDKSSFQNRTHMSKNGAEQFSYAFCDIIKKIEEKENADSMFYKSYDEMKNHSPYMDYLTNNYQNIN